MLLINLLLLPSALFSSQSLPWRVSASILVTFTITSLLMTPKLTYLFLNLFQVQASQVQKLNQNPSWRHRGGKGKPSSCAASLLMCSCGTTKPGRLRKARVGVTSNLWIHRDDPSSFPLLRQSFAAGNLDPSLGTPQGGTGTGRQRAERWHKERPALQPRWQPRTPH